MAILKQSVGTDLSKSDFKACISVIDELQRVTVKSSKTFDNNLRGFKEFSVWMSKHLSEEIPCRIVMEATGIYYEQLAWYLYNNDHQVCVVVPNKAKKYLQSLGLKSKNDKIDAKGLAQMCAEQSLPLWKPLSKKLYQLRSLTRLYEDLTVQVGTLHNQLHALKHSMYDLVEAKQILEKLIEAMKRDIKRMEASIKETVISDALLKAKYDNISRVKGIGMLTFAVVVAETNGFELFYSRSQLTSYAGYDVVESQSGTKVGKTRISKKGNAHLRRILHMPAFTVVKCEPSFQQFYQRIFTNTDYKMKAYVAVQRRLLGLMYTLWKNDVAYDPEYLTNQAKKSLLDGLQEIEKSQAQCALAH